MYIHTYIHTYIYTYIYIYIYIYPPPPKAAGMSKGLLDIMESERRLEQLRKS